MKKIIPERRVSLVYCVYSIANKYVKDEYGHGEMI